MSELQNPIFDEEKEFLERKKLEYERALRGDVEHIKDKTEQVGKIALVGAGLVGGIWLITKAFSGKKRKAKHRGHASSDREADYDDGFNTDYFTGSNGQRYQRDNAPKSAAASAEVFMSQQEQGPEADNRGFGEAPLSYVDADGSDEPAMASYHEAAARDFDAEEEDDAFEDEGFEDDPFQDLPYDDSRRLPVSHAFDGNSGASAPRGSSSASSRSRMVGTVLKSFLESDTGKVLVGQVAAVTLALVTKKVSEFFPTTKNSDLAASPGKAPAEPGTYPVASSASPDFLDASTHSQSL